MKKQKKYSHHLYLSPIEFKDITAMVGDIEFDIKLLISYPEKSFNAVYIDEVNQSKELTHLNRRGTIKDIVLAMEEHGLLVSEYILENESLAIRIQSIVGGDLFFEKFTIAGIDMWGKLASSYLIETGIELKPGVVYDIPEATTIPIPIKSIVDKHYLFYYLLDLQKREIDGEISSVDKDRVYFHTVKVA